MARKWSNENLPGALHFVTSNVIRRIPIFRHTTCAEAFLTACADLRAAWPLKLIAYVLMPDHLHLIVNPRDGRIQELLASLKSVSARQLIAVWPGSALDRAQVDQDGSTHQVWPESFKALPLWSEWLIWQKINYIHANPVKARLVKNAKEYPWSSFRSFYWQESDPLPVDKDWWWPDDVQKLARAVGERNRESEKALKLEQSKSGDKPPFLT